MDEERWRELYPNTPWPDFGEVTDKVVIMHPILCMKLDRASHPMQVMGVDGRRFSMSTPGDPETWTAEFTDATGCIRIVMVGNGQMWRLRDTEWGRAPFYNLSPPFKMPRPKTLDPVEAARAIERAEQAFRK